MLLVPFLKLLFVVEFLWKKFWSPPTPLIRLEMIYLRYPEDTYTHMCKMYGLHCILSKTSKNKGALQRFTSFLRSVVCCDEGNKTVLVIIIHWLLTRFFLACVYEDTLTTKLCSFLINLTYCLSMKFFLHTWILSLLTR